FLDIKQALAQAREAQIEAAVEKVRSRSLAMHKSEELQDVVHTVFERLKELNVDFYTAIIILFTEGSKDIIWWLESKANQQYPRMLVPFSPFTYFNDLFARRAKGADLLSKCYSFDEKNKLFHHLFENTDFKYVPEKQKQFLLGAEFATMSVALAGNTGIQITSYSKKSFSDQDNQIIKRFTKVFDQAYTRFLDLQKAEAQAREAQIETALERVRSRSMAMQKSEELKDVIQVVYQQFVHLNIKVEHSGFVMDYKGRDDYNIWVADPLGVPSQVIIPYFDSVYYNRFNEAKEKGEDFFATNLSFEEKNRFYQKLFEYVPGLTEEAKEFYFSCPGLAASTVLLENIGLYIENFSGTPYTDEENNTLMRFGKVFQQTYTRFLDLQKAEAQAREAQIELGLERVRARAMAMQKSDELKELIGTVSVELTKLDVELDRCFIAIFDPASRSSTWWMASPETPSTPRGLRMKYHEMPPYLAYLAAWEERKLKWQYVLEGAVKKSWDSFIFSETEFSCLPDFVIANMRANEKVFLNASFNSFGCLTLATLAPVSEENFDILLRFAKVFDLTYTRFNDLQKAEAQAREAKIEAALERVRAKAMAMHKSEDLSQAVATVFEELDKLNLGTLRCGIGIINKEKRSADYWVTSVSDQERYVQMAGDETMDSHPLLQGAFQAWLKQEDFSYALKGDDLARYYKAMVDTNFPLPESQFILSGDDLSEQYYHLACFEAGGLFAFRDTPFPEEAKSVMKRFAGVFNLTYKRFLDLQRAEAQAREAQVQLALERVRARTMAMQKSDELLETSQVLYRQLKELGEPADQLTIGIVNEQDRVVEVSATRDDSHLKQIFRHSIDEPVVMNKMYEDWKAGKKSKVMDISGEELRLYNQYRNQLVGSAMFPTTLQEGDRRVLHAAYFSKGMLALATVDPRPEESIQLLERFATVFELTYTRFLDLQKAEAQARESRIEASLERVRSKAMAMHSSQDLADTIGAFYHELQTFSITPRRCGVGLLEKGTRMAELSTMNTTEKGGSIEIVGRLKMEGHPVLEGVYENWLAQKEFHPVLRGNEIKEYYQLLKPQIQFPDYPNDSVQYGYFFYFTEGGVYAWTDKEMAEEELKIYRRFTTVLSLTYKRYKELKEAEAQTRESQIELGLERVRARAMAMQKSDELKELIGTVFTELTKLDLVLTRCVIMIYDTKTSGSTWWMANSEAGSEPMSFFVKYHEKLPYLAYLGAWQERKLKWQYVLEGKDKLDWDDFLFAETELSNLPDFVIAGMRAAERVYLSASFNN
ncbi:MAG TPA: hypothetical protein VFX58_05465, partial [Chitinophagaceae bacterium]|nr:hypothetical protein [Chitinophagaceae bacterium]